MAKRGRWATVVFDLRTIIGVLFLVYGVVCLIYGLAADQSDAEQRSGGINVNVWTGGGMLLLSAAFLSWSILRPIEQDNEETDDQDLKDTR